jgi:chorismate dehydratase
VGAVTYLNTKPLVYRLVDRAPRIELSFDVPSRLADQLATGQLDVALIPSVEVFHNPRYRVISNACIGCRGPVLSVKLLSRRPLSSIRTLALDEGSRTSVALVRILLEQRVGVSPQLVPLPLGLPPEQAEADAVLVIGDRAIHPPQSPFQETWDLGAEWCRWFGLPFVFAMWTAAPDFESPELARALEEARDDGVAHLPEIARQASPLVGLAPEACLSYLRDNLYFYLGEREREALSVFHRHAARLGLVPPAGELAWQSWLPAEAVASS